MSTPRTATLLVDCPDRKGIVAAIMNFLVQEYDVNILYADQQYDVETTPTRAASSKVIPCV